MSPRIRVASAALGMFGPALAPAAAQEAPAPIVPRSAAVASTSSGGVGAGRLNVENLAIATGPRAVVKVDGLAAPGLKVTLDGSASTGGRVWYRWFQTQGERVTLAGADQAVASFVVPEDGTVLGFVLVVGNNAGVDVRAAVVEPEDPDAAGDDRPLAADAGPDQTVAVGHRVTLDGGKSEPKGRIRFRWVQADGPPAALHGSGGPACSFVPDAPGAYKFALLAVGETGLVSEASLVVIHARAGTGDGSGGGGSGGTADAPVDPAATEVDELARTSLRAFPVDSKLGPDLARACDAVADRVASFRAYEEAIGAVVRQLDAVAARDPKHRGDWADRFVKPWSEEIAALMHVRGADRPQLGGRVKPLTPAQRAFLAEQIRFTAAGFRAGSSLR